ncbi:MAG: sigma-54 dependent transcriptional regulator [Myxococcota bacterium]|nr:sigma-54 dependent transcriptional regulator [Myxococcota bacterium]
MSHEGPSRSALRHVLILDEEEPLRHMLALLLSREGYTATAVATAEQALAELDARPCDVVLCDLRPTQPGGLDLIEDLRCRPRPPAVIVMSASGGMDLALEAIRRGAYDYIAKPFRPDEVIFVLRKAEERERMQRDSLLRSRPGPSSRDTPALESIVARTPRMLELFRTIRKIAEFKTTVLITGASGTGPAGVARPTPPPPPRAAGPLVAINCGAIPATLLESELFGHKKGAFTDAVRDKRGRFEEASSGTLFLDEIGELPVALQVKLLRALQEQEIRPLGGTTDIKVDTRVIAATVRDLQAEVAAGRFREDLYYRLNVLHIHLPPLRERREDIPVLIEHFIRRMNAKLGTRIEGTTPEAARLLMEYSWPGNVRELENTIERAVVLCEGRLLTVADLPEKLTGPPPLDPLQVALQTGELSIKKTTRAIEEALIRKALKKTGGNRTSAARILEISHRALLYKIKEFGITDRE